MIRIVCSSGDGGRQHQQRGRFLRPAMLAEEPFSLRHRVLHTPDVSQEAASDPNARRIYQNNLSLRSR